MDINTDDNIRLVLNNFLQNNTDGENIPVNDITDGDSNPVNDNKREDDNIPVNDISDGDNSLVNNNRHVDNSTVNNSKRDSPQTKECGYYCQSVGTVRKYF